MASDRRSMTLGSMDIANRKLPDLPDEAYGGSKLSRFWSTLKSKISSSSRHSSLRRSQSVTADPHTGTEEYPATTLSYSIYNQLIDNHENMVLPGLRQYPPPIEEDDDIPISLPPIHPSRSLDYADIEIYEGAPANGVPDQQPDPSPQINEYQDIDDLSKMAADSTLRIFPGRRQKPPQMAALASSISSLHHQGWYWGPLNREETESKLRVLPSGSFLVRDSNDAHHMYTLSFKKDELILHTRIEFVNGLFTFFLSEERAKESGKRSVQELIVSSMANGVKGEFGDSRRVRGGRRQAQSSIRIILTQPVSRFTEVRSLQFLCKFVLRSNMNRESVADLPLPKHVRTWVHERDYFA